ncbi:MAG TPA: FmdB family zinc ribbon protein [Thermoanaerobaculia bacterium]|nr:FmdB family zinc ribbon protein [Thermoanaerobaculia bacterium]
MPLYEYQCQNCGKKTEVIQRFDDAPLAACPSCGGEVKKLISSPAFQFKGTGWYVTDYAGKKGPGSSEPKAGKSDGGDKGEKADKGDSADKAGKAEKAEKSEKAAVAETKSSGGAGGSE